MDHPLRPRGPLQEYAALRVKDLEVFHAQFRSMDNQFQRPCPACDQNQSVEEFTKDGFAFHRCTRCACIYVNPIPSETLLGRYYDGSASMEYFHREILEPTLDRRRVVFRDRIDRMRPFIRQADRILEIGSSIGLFLEAALREGWDVTGVEINSELVGRLRCEFDVPVYQGFFESICFSEKYEVVVLWEVLEHLRDPGKVLECAKSILTSRGRIIMTMPNFDGLEFRICGKEHELVEAPGHLNYFTIDTLNVLFRRHGFEISHYETPGVLDFTNIMSAIQDSPDDAIASRFLRQIASLIPAEDLARLNEVFTSIIQRNLLSGNMFVVAQVA